MLKVRAPSEEQPEEQPAAQPKEQPASQPEEWHSYETSKKGIPSRASYTPGLVNYC